MAHNSQPSILLGVLLIAAPAPADDATEFFESKVRPLLAQECHECHSDSAKTVEAGLLLDSHSGVQRGSDSGAVIVPGDPESSLLIRAVRYEENEMPPDARLSEKQVAILVEWVKQGAIWPQTNRTTQPVKHGEDYDWEKLRSEHWAFRPVQKRDLPQVADASWPQNNIDHFVLSQLEAAGLSASSIADDYVLARRIYLNLTGLLPTPKQLERFITRSGNDPTAAVTELVDTLLEQPQYGERWARHWLDVARFSDGLGGSTNPTHNTEAWQYRDWVVQAFNQDLPYDEFVRMQIAGDLLGNHHSAVATGFFALGPIYRSDGGDLDSIAQAKGETLDDRVDTLSRGLLALTVSCARCHDHKFDPIPQTDYYSLAGIFNNTGIHDVPLAESDVVQSWNAQHNAIEDLKKRVRNLEQNAKKQNRRLTDEEIRQREDWNRDLRKKQESLPVRYPVAHALRDTGSNDMKVALRGNLRKPGETAPRRIPKILSDETRVRFTEGSGRRQLAQAITNPDNPLLSRVIVNRVWMHHFGKALVRSPGNFGVSGELPSHPDLLDWLASEFVASGWSFKWLHRTILTSAAWQQSSQRVDAAWQTDADNRLLWRMNPRRMDVEAWRDSLLAVTGELDLALGGPPFDDPEKSRRRTLYARVSRNGDQIAADWFLRRFDFPLMRATVVKRPVSVVPQQFLFLMNSSFMVDRASVLAKELTDIDQPEDWIRGLYLKLYSRLPTKAEEQIALEYLAATDSSDALLPAVQYAQVLLCSNEFMFVR